MKLWDCHALLNRSSPTALESRGFDIQTDFAFPRRVVSLQFQRENGGLVCLSKFRTPATHVTKPKILAKYDASPVTAFSITDQRNFPQPSKNVFPNIVSLALIFPSLRRPRQVCSIPDEGGGRGAMFTWELHIPGVD